MSAPLDDNATLAHGPRQIAALDDNAPTDHATLAYRFAPAPRSAPAYRFALLHHSALPQPLYAEARP